jgi:hypothetical protein
VHLSGGRLEDDRIRLQALERGARHRPAADAVLAHEQDGARRFLGKRAEDQFDELPAAADEERRWVIERALPGASELGEELEIDCPSPPRLERFTKALAELIFVALDERLDVRCEAKRDVPAERVFVDNLASRPAIVDEIGQVVAADSLVDLREDGPDDWIRRMFQERLVEERLEHGWDAS